MRIFNLILGFTLLIAINNFGQNNKSAMEQRMSFITLGVENLDKSVDFYENKFGWKRSELSNDKMILFQLNGILLSLYDRHKLAEDATVDSTGSGFKAVSYKH